LSSTNYNKTIFSYATIKGYLKHGCYEGWDLRGIIFQVAN
jgi:hypothetical protein